ncbi:MAG TPA: EF-Tu/IF-2/RF-3 family GTPase, partial [Acetobacteraceae bacterium]|nr:EF-Tu/IF-2/RF-3 family GTPase [Acetobacteraceae bacterium]
PLLDAVIDYLPSPIDVPGIAVALDEGVDETLHPDRRRIKADPKAPFAGLAFKIINDKYGTLTFVRVYAGTLKSGDTVMNTTKGHRERIGRMFQMHADKRAEIKEVEAGDIAAFVGLKDTATGDTLASNDDPVVLERMAFPVPVIDYLPSPVDVPGIAVALDEDQDEADHPDRRRIKADPKAPFAGLAFKIINDKYGTLTFVRVYAGTLKSGDMVMNTTKGHRERIGRMFQMHADKRAEIKEVEAGDIAAFVGLKDTATGDTLASNDDPVVLERMAFPVPVIDISVEPRTKEAVEKMTLGLQKLAGEDPSLRLRTDQETGQTILSGMGELHLEIIIDRLRREYGVDCNIGAPQVAYRETISKPYTETYTHKKQSGGSGQYAEVKIIFEPQERNAGVVFENKVVGGSVPKEYIPAVEKGIKVQADTGVLAGFPTVDFKYTLVDGKYHDVDSSALAFEIAAKACFREGMKHAGPIILEPIMDVEVTTPQDHVGDVVGDLNRRRGQIQNQESSGSTVIVRALVPLKEMFGYISHLRSMTKGRASFTMQFHHYDPVPRNIADEIMAKSA